MAVLATDNFNRADENPIGAPWTVRGSGTAGKIVSNTLRMPGSGNDSGIVYTGITWPNDQYSQVTLVTVPNAQSAGDGVGVIVRGNTSGTLTQYELVCASGAAGTTIAKRVNGVYKQLAHSVTTWVAGDVAYLEIRGNTLQAKRNGSTAGMPAPVTDNDPDAIVSGSCGIMASVEGTIPEQTLDDWEGGDFSTGSPPAPPHSLTVSFAVNRASNY
jgi:hypothetical protein